MIRAVHIARPWMADALHVWELEDLGGSCRLVQRGDMQPRGARWLLSPLVSLILRRQLCDCAQG